MEESREKGTEWTRRSTLDTGNWHVKNVQQGGSSTEVEDGKSFLLMTETPKKNSKVSS